MPSAASAYALHRPSRASARNRENSTNGPGVASTVTPPASASEHSPPRSDCTARCNATSDDEHAVSTVTAGPCNPNEEEIRLEALPPVRGPPACSPDPPTRHRESSTKGPAKTLVALPRSDAGSIPARSSASHAVSSSSRCCGSIATASRGETPKNPGSNSAASCTNPPARTYEVPT